MIDPQFKTQPVAAFYKLLRQSFPFILLISFLLTILIVLVINSILNLNLSSDGIREISDIFSNPTTELQERSELLKHSLEKYPNLINGFFLMFLTGLITLAYLIYTSQKHMKNKLFNLGDSLLKSLIPDKAFLKILMYLTLVIGFFTFSGGFIAVSIAGSPFFGIIAALFLIILLTRTVLYIPGLILGELSISESFSYSFQTITGGRAFKVLIFGLITFFLLSTFLTIIIKMPLINQKGILVNLFSNFIVFYLQMAIISIGMIALFIRYGNFETENITD